MSKKLHFEVTGGNKDMKRVLAEVRQDILNSGNASKAVSESVAAAFRKNMYDSSLKVGELTQKMIQQRGIIKEVEKDVKSLGQAYKNNKYGHNAPGALREWTAAKKALDEEKAALFGLQQQQQKARLSARKLKDEYTYLTSQTKKMTGSTQAMGMSLGRAFAATGGIYLLRQLGREIISTRAKFEQMDMSIRTMLGGNDEMADALIGKLKHFAAISPLTFSSISSAAEMMIGFNIDTEKVPMFIEALGDISRGNTQKFQSLTLAFSQMSAAGKLMGQDLNQMINAGFNPLQIIAEKTGKTIGILKEEMSKGAISTELVQQAFIDATSAGGRFYKMSEEGSKTMTGQMSMFRGALDNAFNDIGTSSQGMIMGVIKGGTALVQSYETVGRVILTLVELYGVYRAALLINTAMELGHARALLGKVKAINANVVATKLLNAAMKVNPYVMAATVIAGLAVIMWNLRDSTTAAERAQESFNKRQEDAAQKAEAYKTKLEELISAMNDEYSSTDAKARAMGDAMEIMKEMGGAYPDIFQKYIDEKGHIGDLTGLWKELNEETSKTDRARRVEDLSVAKASLEKAEKSLSETKGSSFYSRAVVKRDSDLVDRRRKEFDLAQAEVDKDSLLQWHIGLKNRTDEEIKIELDEYKRQQSELKNGKQPNNPTIDKRVSALKGEASLRANATTYAQDLDTAKKEWEAAKVALLSIEKDKEAFSSKQYEEAKKKTESTKATYDRLGGDTTTEGKQLKKDESKQLKLETDALKKYHDAILDQTEKFYSEENELAKSQFTNKIDIINHERDIALDAIEAERKAHKALAKDAKKEPDKEVLKMLDMREGLVDAGADNQRKEHYDSLLQEFEDYKQAYERIEKEYSAKREQMHDINPVTKEETLKKEFSQDNVDNLDSGRQSALDAVNIQFAEKQDVFEAWCNQIADMTLAELENTLIKAEAELDKVDKGDNDAVALARAKVVTAKNEIAKERAKAETGVDKRTIEEWAELQGVLNGVSSSFQEVGDSIGGATGEMISGAGVMAASMVSMVDGIVTFATTGIKGIAAASGAAATAIKAVEAASVILLVISAAIQIATKIASLFSKEKEHQVALQSIADTRIQQQREYNSLLHEQNLLYEKGVTIFGNDVFGAANNAVKEAKEAKEALDQFLKESENPENPNKRTTSNRGKWDAPDPNGSKKAKYAGLADIEVVVDSEKTGLFGWGGEQDVYGSILDKYPDLIKANGELDKGLAQSILSTETMSETDKERLQQAITLTEEYEASVAMMNDYLTGIFGDLGNAMSDALVDSFRNGTDASEAFGASVSSMLEKLSQDVAYSMHIAPILEEAQKEIDAINKNDSLSEEERALALQEVAMDTANDLAAAEKGFHDTLQTMTDGAAAGGVEIFDPNEDRQAATKGIATASQESVDENNGRLTAIQGNTYEMLKHMETLVDGNTGMIDIMTTIADNTSYCRHLEAIDKNISLMRDGMDATNLKGTPIKK